MREEKSNLIPSEKAKQDERATKSMCNYMWNISEASYEAEVDCETRETRERERF